MVVVAPLEAKGRLLWVPGPSSAPWLVLAAVLFAVLAAAGLLLRGRAFRAVFAAGVLAVLVSDVVHTFGAAAAVVLARVCVTVSTGVGFGLVAAGILSRRRAVAGEAAASGTEEPVASIA